MESWSLYDARGEGARRGRGGRKKEGYGWLVVCEDYRYNDNLLVDSFIPSGFKSSGSNIG